MLITENHLVAIPVDEFFAFNHHDYIDVHMEFAEDRTKLMELIGNAILQQPLDHNDFVEMLSLQLGYMGIDPILEVAFYESMIRYVRSASINGRKYIPNEVTPGPMVYVVEEPDNVNLIFKVYRSTDGAPHI